MPGDWAADAALRVALARSRQAAEEGGGGAGEAGGGEQRAEGTKGTKCDDVQVGAAEEQASEAHVKTVTLFVDVPPAVCAQRREAGWERAEEGGGVCAVLEQVDEYLFERLLERLVVEDIEDAGDVGKVEKDAGGVCHDGEGRKEAAQATEAEAEGAPKQDTVLVLDWREVGRVEDVWNLVRGATEGGFVAPAVGRAAAQVEVCTAVLESRVLLCWLWRLWRLWRGVPLVAPCVSNASRYTLLGYLGVG